MNYNVFRYRTARNALIAARDVVERFGARPVCMMSDSEWHLYASAEERTVLIPQMIDRLRFEAKHNRSKYTPHQGPRECDRRNPLLDDRMCGGWEYEPKAEKAHV